MLPTKISSLYAGGTGLLDPEGQVSGIFKRPVMGRIAVSALGLDGDIHWDQRAHGGPEKAVHQYPAENYSMLAAQFPECAADLVSGSFGENISARGMNERTVHLGDIFKIGEVLLQVSQPRSPCWKINHRFGAERMSMHVATQRITGWYYRVLNPGFIEPGDEILPVHRQASRFSIDEFWRVQLAHRPVLDDLSDLASIPGLSEDWKMRLRNRLEWLRKQR